MCPPGAMNVGMGTRIQVRHADRASNATSSPGSVESLSGFLQEPDLEPDRCDNTLLRENYDMPVARLPVGLSENDVLAANAATLDMIQQKKASKPTSFEDRSSMVVLDTEEARENGKGALLRPPERVPPSSSSRSSIASGASFGARQRRAEESSMEITHAATGKSANLRLEAQRLFIAADAHAKTLADTNAPLGKEVQSKLTTRIARDERLASELERAVHSAEPLIYMLEQCLNDLERTHRNFWPQVSVSKQRQQLRESCPTRQLDEDYLQQALKYEQKMVSRGRKSLADAKKEGVQLLKDLNDHFKDAHIALKKKRFAAGHDKTCLLVTQERKQITSKLLKDNKEVEVDREGWAASVQSLLNDFVLLQGQSKEYRASMDDLILDKKSIAEGAAKQTLELFKKHTAEMHRLRDLIRKEMHESQDTISSMERTLALSKQQLSKVSKKVNAAEVTHKKATTSSAHSGRSTLVESLETNFQKVSNCQIALEQHIAWNQALLSDMRKSHKALEEDFKRKTEAMKYTDQCLLLTPKPEEDPRTARSRAMELQHKRREEHVREELKPGHLAEIHRRMRAAAPLGFAGRPDFDALIEKINPERLGELTDQQIKIGIRSRMRLDKEFMTDQQIISFCDMLDGDGSGCVHVSELKEFLEREPAHDFDDIPVVDYPQELSAKAKRELAEERAWVRPRRHEIPLIKNSQMQLLKQRIKSAAAIAALDHSDLGSDDDHVRELFELYDKDYSGLLSDLEVKRAMRYGLKISKRDLSDAEMWAIICLLDDDNSGKIDVNELVNWVHDV